MFGGVEGDGQDVFLQDGRQTCLRAFTSADGDWLSTGLSPEQSNSTCNASRTAQRIKTCEIRRSFCRRRKHESPLRLALTRRAYSDLAYQTLKLACNFAIAAPTDGQTQDEYLVEAFLTLSSTCSMVAIFQRYTGYKQASQWRLTAKKKPNNQFLSEAASLTLCVLSLNPKCT